MWEEGRRLVDFFKKKPSGEVQNGAKIEEDPRPDELEEKVIGKIEEAKENGWLSKSDDVKELFEKFNSLVNSSGRIPKDLVKEADKIKADVMSGSGEESEIIEKIEDFMNAVEFRKAVNQ